MADGLGLVAGLALARREGVAPADEVRIALIPYMLGLTPISLIVTQALARNAAPPPPTRPAPPTTGGPPGPS